MTVVVGGAYAETCNEPFVERVYGSGTRAAAVLADQCTRFVTVADTETLNVISSHLAGTSIRATRRLAPVQFAYDTPLSPPRLLIEDSDRGVEMDDIRAEDAIVFGMVEAQPMVTADRIVVDPQHSLGIDEINETIDAGELVIAASRGEMLRLARTSDLRVAVQKVIDECAAAAIVVKAGALGAVVVRPGSEPQGVAAFQTLHVMPIGSGDVFTAELARQYFASGELLAAAQDASRRTAGYVWTRQLSPVPLPDDCPAVATPTLATIQHPPAIYVAASFASPEQRWSASTVAKGIEDIGARSIYPLWDIGLSRDAVSTATDDLNELDACDGVVLLADVARTGPFFEAGWATARGLPIVVMASDTDPRRYTMLRGTHADIVDDLSTAAYRSIWAAVEHRRATNESGRLMLLSGGLDSALVAAVEQPERALFVDYGQMSARAERAAAQTVADHLGIELDTVTIDASSVGTGQLVKATQARVAPSPAWFPFRNQLLVTIAAAHAIKIGLGAVLIGTVADDGLRHADGTRRFIASLDTLVRLQEGGIRVAAPQADTPTRKLLSRCRLPDEVVNATHSCDVGDTPCGECGSCSRRSGVLSGTPE